MTKQLYDVVYYWSVNGRCWHEMRSENLHKLVFDIERRGRVAVLGHSALGPPHNPPTAEALQRVGSGA